MRGIAKILLIAALMVSIGGQWIVLQSAAWVSMAVTYSLKEGSVAQGLTKTFDGQHPCALCKVVAKGQHTDKKGPEEMAAKLKIDLFCDTIVGFVTHPVVVGFAVIENRVSSSSSPTPPVPPPRGEATAV